MTKGKKVNTWDKGFLPSPGKTRGAGWTATPIPAGWIRVQGKPHHFSGPNRTFLRRAQKGWELYRLTWIHDECIREDIMTSTLAACVAFVALDTTEVESPDPFSWVVEHKTGFYRTVYEGDFNTIEDRVAKAMVADYRSKHQMQVDIYKQILDWDNGSK